MKQTPFQAIRDGLTLRGEVIGSCEPGRPAVIICHGFLSTGRSVHHYASVLADAGFLTVTFDFSGGAPDSRSDGSSADMTLLSEKADLLAVTAAVRAQFRPASLSLMGCSQGGFVAGMAAKELGSAQISRLVMIYPALCIPDDARHGRLMCFPYDPADIPEILGTSPMVLSGRFARTAMQMDPFEEIGGYDGPVLLIHGTADNVVDIRYARQARGVYPDCEYHEIEGGGHGFGPEHDAQAKALLKAFMQPLLPKAEAT